MFKMSNKKTAPHRIDCDNFQDLEALWLDSPSKYFRRGHKQKQEVCVLMLSTIRICCRESVCRTASVFRPTAGGLCLDKCCLVLLILVRVISMAESALREHTAEEWRKQQLKKLVFSCLL